ncbi:hypothetical protein CLCR_07171 [Cladophialophora carrionii]|uniref:Uncharacterized protein n=1 Tax=Cladophialophora carrionii TaxID=86049 RepID=A0A1C1CPL3_9EURO|nr:hypothetical protein CLCR_07171 [Cladophialophora carrionii]
MASRVQLQYELAQIELEKRQLGLEERQLELERKELAVKHRLMQLMAIDLTEDSAQVKTEPRDGSTDDPQATISNTVSAELPPVGAPRANSTTNSAPGHEDDTMVENNSTMSSAPGHKDQTTVEEKPERSASSNSTPPGTTTANAVAEPSPTAEARPRKEAVHEQQRCQSPAPAPTPTPTSTHTPTSQLADTPTDDQGLLAMFMAKPSDTMPEPQTGVKRGCIESDDESPISDVPTKIPRRRKINFESAEESLTFRGSGKEPRRRKIKLERIRSRLSTRRSRAKGVKEADSRMNGRLTETDQCGLISSYTDLFLKHMQTIEQGLTSKDGNGKHAISSRMRKLNVGKTYTSITLLHREFERVADDHATSLSIRTGLQAEMKKFENALPYWSPKCKALPKQSERQAMVHEVVGAIAMGLFDSEKYKDCYDPYDEL